MKDLLDFLNTSSPDEIKNLPGITPAQAEEFVSARPFSSLEDVNRVKLLSSEEFGHLKEEYGKLTPQEPVVDKKTIAEAEMKANPAPAANNIGRIVTRIVIALLIIGVLFVAVYFGIPLFKEKILNPLQNNTSRVGEIATQQAINMQNLSAEITSLQNRIATLETRADTVDISLQAHTDALANLEKMQTDLRSSSDVYKTEIFAQIDEQLTLTRAIELLGRSRLYLSQSNFGQAQTDVSAARGLLYGLLTTISPDQANGLRVVINRLDLALSNLPVYPVVAVFDVDVAWQLLVDGLPNVPQVAVTPIVEPQTPTVTTVPLESTPTPTP